MNESTQKRETNLRRVLPHVKLALMLLVAGALVLCSVGVAVAEPSRMDEVQQDFNRRAAAARSGSERQAIMVEAYQYVASLCAETDLGFAAVQAERDGIIARIAEAGIKLDERTDGGMIQEMVDLHARLGQLDATLPGLVETKNYRDGQMARLASLTGLPGPGAPAPTPGAVAVSDPNAPMVVQVAMAQLGKPYVYGAGGPGAFDCSGLVSYSYAAVGIILPHYSYDQARYGPAVSRADLQPGDLVFFRKLGHVGIYIGDGQYIHAPRTGDVVRVANLDRRSDFCYACRPGV
ncbi:MAG: C40 family peptidase [Candidatus Geothermincolia bacterium]